MAAASSTQQQVTQLLVDWSSGDTAALDKLIPLVQPELHRLAHYYMSREGEGHTLQTTALVNEAYLQFVDKTHPRWQNRPQDRKSTRLNSSHSQNSYAAFCLKKKKTH